MIFRVKILKLSEVDKKKTKNHIYAFVVFTVLLFCVWYNELN